VCIAEEDPDDGRGPKRIENSTTELEFRTISAAREAFENLQSMQQELFVLYLQYPRCGEQIMFERAAGDLMVRDFYLTNTRLSVVLNPSEGRYRLILLSGCRLLSICMECRHARSVFSLTHIAVFYSTLRSTEGFSPQYCHRHFWNRCGLPGLVCRIWEKRHSGIQTIHRNQFPIVCR